jgi:hypothetical protein
MSAVLGDAVVAGNDDIDEQLHIRHQPGGQLHVGNHADIARHEAHDAREGLTPLSSSSSSPSSSSSSSSLSLSSSSSPSSSAPSSSPKSPPLYPTASDAAATAPFEFVDVLAHRRQPLVSAITSEEQAALTRMLVSRKGYVGHYMQLLSATPASRNRSRGRRPSSRDKDGLPPSATVTLIHPGEDHKDLPAATASRVPDEAASNGGDLGWHTPVASSTSSATDTSTSRSERSRGGSGAGSRGRGRSVGRRRTRSRSGGGGGEWRRREAERTTSLGSSRSSRRSSGCSSRSRNSTAAFAAVGEQGESRSAAATALPRPLIAPEREDELLDIIRAHKAELRSHGLVVKSLEVSATMHRTQAELSQALLQKLQVRGRHRQNKIRPASATRSLTNNSSTPRTGLLLLCVGGVHATLGAARECLRARLLSDVVQFAVRSRD